MYRHSLCAFGPYAFYSICRRKGKHMLKAVAEDDDMAYKLDNTEFIMYQVGACKNNSWILTPQFASSGILFDFENSSAQGTAADKLEKYARIIPGGKIRHYQYGW